MNTGQRRIVAGAALVLALSVAITAQDPSQIAAIDQIFAKWSGRDTPGCVLGVSHGNSPTLVRTYGMADLAHGIPNGEHTVFESGSVSKQFVAAAMLLLVRDGRLSLDDPARKYLPELPDYGAPLTIRHMLTHTSGLREWGALVEIAGEPRWMRHAYTQDEVLQIASRQRSLNFLPGTRWSYTNTGYNLAAVIVSRVSGTTIAEFSRTRLFEPLGMTHTSWDTDHTRVVKDRATAYAEKPDGFHTYMPFEDVYGNRGVQTTVGDLLIWNRHFESPIVGDRAFVEEQQQPGRLADGRRHPYGLGLYINKYKGVPEVGHEGGTAGYRADLIRFPEQRLSIAVLCNVAAATATAYAHAVADLYLPARRPESAPSTTAYTPTKADLARATGMYRNAVGRSMVVEPDGKGLRLVYSGFPIPLRPVSPVRYSTSIEVTFTLEGPNTAFTTDADGLLAERWFRVQAVKPSSARLRELAGIYASDEMRSKMVVTLKSGSLILARPSMPDVTLMPAYKDAFAAGQFGTVVFRRNKAGRVHELSVVQDGPYDGVWALRFRRVR